MTCVLKQLIKDAFLVTSRSCFHKGGAEHKNESSNIAVFDLGTAKELFEVDLTVRLCACDIRVNNSDIYKGVILLSALYVSTAFLKLYRFSMVGHPKVLNTLLRLRVKTNGQDKNKKICSSGHMYT